MSEQQYDNEMRGVLFKNKDRDKETQPHAKGSCQVEGVEYWISAWTQTSKNGERYQSLSYQRKDEVHAKGVAQAKEAMAPDNPMDDDIPF